MSVKLCHKALAECHDLSVRFSLRVKIGTAFTAADRKSGKRIFKYLFKSKEFNNAQVNRRMQTEASLIRADSTVELNTETCIYMYLSLIINPGNAEHNLSFRINQSFQ